eukprot:9550226-Alexandrium_andersonii.AAC.1
MSASLVGSEMCIRDSLDAGGALARGVGSTKGLLDYGFALRAASAGRLAVSYTHLTLPTICSV